MKLLIGLCGYILLMLGVILALHYDMTLGLIIAGFFTCKWFFMFPQMEGRDDL